MPEFEISFGALKVRVEAATHEEALEKAEKMVRPSTRGERLLGLFGIAPVRAESVEEARDLPVGAGSEAD